MNPFLRDKPDGRRAAGYLTYLLGGLAAAAAVLWLHHRIAAGEDAPVRVGKARQPSNVAAITQSAAAISPVKVAGKPSPGDPRSYRMDKPAGATPQSSAGAPNAASGQPFNAIAAALAAPVPAAAANSGFAALPPAFEQKSDPAGGTAKDRDAASPVQLFGYRDTAADVTRADSTAVADRASASSSSGAIVPRGTLICVYLLTTVDTANPAAVLQFGAARDLVFDRRRMLPFGTRFLGKLSGRAARSRINLTVDTILYPDGRELPVSASAVEADDGGGSIYPGVAADYVPPPVWAQAAPYFSDFFAGAMGLLQSRAERPLQVGIGGVSVQSGTADDLRGPLYQASAQAVQDFTASQLKEIEERYGGHYLVPAGTAFWLQLDADLKITDSTHASHE